MKSFVIVKEVFGHEVGTRVFTDDEGKHSYTNKLKEGRVASHTGDYALAAETGNLEEVK